MTMATATLKLFSLLAPYLPEGSVDNQTTIEVGAGTSVDAVIAMMRVPTQRCQVVLLNGVFVAPSERPGTTVRPGDALAIWPLIGGG